MKYKIFDVEKFFIEIEQEKQYGNGKMITTWYWDVTIGKHGEIYKGMAKEHNKGELLPWTELVSDKPLDELIQYCKNLMNYEH